MGNTFCICNARFVARNAIKLETMTPFRQQQFQSIQRQKFRPMWRQKFRPPKRKHFSVFSAKSLNQCGAKSLDHSSAKRLVFAAAKHLRACELRRWLCIVGRVFTDACRFIFDVFTYVAPHARQGSASFIFVFVFGFAPLAVWSVLLKQVM